MIAGVGGRAGGRAGWLAGWLGRSEIHRAGCAEGQAGTLGKKLELQARSRISSFSRKPRFSS